MFENDRMETGSKAVTSIQHRNDLEISTFRTRQYFVDFESRIHVEISTSNLCNSFHVDLQVQNRCNLDKQPAWNFNIQVMANLRRCAH